MNSKLMKKYGFLFLTLVALLFVLWQFFSYIEGNLSNPSSPIPAHSSGPEVAEKKAVPTPRKQPDIHYKRPDFEAGIVFPEWSTDGYGSGWQQQLPAIQEQTGARWMEMSLFFSQATPSSTQVGTNQSTPTIQSFTDGIKAAHALGYHVFVVPLMGVDSPAGQWAGTIQFSTYQEQVQWFDSYWQALQPYVTAAAQVGADQLAIGTELVLLQQDAPPALWNTLIARIHAVFPGPLTYDMNWTSLDLPLAAWLNNTQLTMIGVSEYIPLVNDRIRVDPANMPGLWKTIVKAALDKVAIQLKKPIVISEIGYRNSADTLYNSWLPYSTVSPPDPVEQAAACDAALTNVISDGHIGGIFFWAWDNAQGFKLSGQPAAQVLKKWYTSAQS